MAVSVLPDSAFSDLPDSAFSALPDLAPLAPALSPDLARDDLALLVAPPSSSVSCSAAAKATLRSARSSATRSVPSAPGSPLNFCQSPVISRILRTGSVGCAPTESQCCARSEFTSMNEGSAFGWYLPISSMARPSRLVRASATTIR